MPHWHHNATDVGCDTDGGGSTVILGILILICWVAGKLGPAFSSNIDKFLGASAMLNFSAEIFEVSIYEFSPKTFIRCSWAKLFIGAAPQGPAHVDPTSSCSRYYDEARTNPLTRANSRLSPDKHQGAFSEVLDGTMPCTERTLKSATRIDSSPCSGGMTTKVFCTMEIDAGVFAKNFRVYRIIAVQ